MKPLNAVARSIAPSGIRQLAESAKSMREVISLGIGEPDFAVPPPVREAALASIQAGCNGYTPNAGLPGLREAVSAHLDHRVGVRYDPCREVLITAGVSEGLDLSLRALLEPGDEVICIAPTYLGYRPLIRSAGGVPVVVDARAEDGFSLPVDRLASAVTQQTKAILLCSPNNPTGTVAARPALQAIVEIAVDHDLFLVSDEVYSRFTYGPPHVSVSSLSGARERTILLDGFSKTYAMTGWRVAYACAAPAIIEAMLNIHQYTVACAPRIAQQAAIAALRCDNGYVSAVVAEYDQRRKLFLTGLRAAGLPCHEPSGAFYVFPSIEGSGLSSEVFAARLLEEERVLLVPGSTFGDSGRGFVRCAYTVETPTLVDALGRIKRFVDRCGSRRGSVI